MIEHDVEEQNEHGVQSCRRCGQVVSDRLLGHRPFKPGAVYSLYDVDSPVTNHHASPEVVQEVHRREAVKCGWRVH